MNIDQPGLTVTRFFQSLSDASLRRFVDSEILSLLDAIFNGNIDRQDLCQIAAKVVDFNELLRDSQGRNLVLGEIPSQKRKELAARIDRPICPENTADWSKAELNGLREFFALFNDTIPNLPDTVVSSKFGLFDYQRKAVQEIFPLLTHGDRRAILHLPTGVGKTRTAMHVVARFLQENDPSVVVWLASGKELLEQALETFVSAWTHLGNRQVQTAVLQGNTNLNLARFKDGFLAVSLSKGWRMLSTSDTEWAINLATRVRLVVFDEAHQSIAPTYARITEELMMDYRCALLGLTATPGRTWSDIDEDGRLADFYASNKVTLDVPGDNPITYLIENGYLAKPTFRTLLAEPGLSINQNELLQIAELLEIPDEIVSALSMSEQYVTAVLRAVECLLKEEHTRIIVFAASVKNAHLLTAILLARNTKSVAVTSETSTQDRAEAIRLFKSNSTKPVVLVNFGVFTTGFDAPKVSAAVIARPTKSLVLYSQMVGRAIRGPQAGGTETCVIVTVQDPSLHGFGDVGKAFLNWEDVW